MNQEEAFNDFCRMIAKIIIIEEEANEKIK